MTVGKMLTYSPDTPVFRKDLENAAYAALKTDPTNEILQQNLRELLTQHAQAVMYSILRRNDAALVSEAVDRVMLHLDTFREDSLFTSWAHRIITTTMYMQRRTERRLRETALDAAEQMSTSASFGVVDILQTARKVLNETQYSIFVEKAVNGRTLEEVVAVLKIPFTSVQRNWKTIERVLRDALA